MSDRELVESIWWAGVKSVQGYQCVKKALAGHSNFHPTHIAAVGKAASSMMRAALDHCGSDLPALLVTKYGHLDGDTSVYSNLQVIEAAHPVPDENSLMGGKTLLDFVTQCSGDARLLLLVSGGASALAEYLPSGINLEDLQKLNLQMLRDGLDIHAINKRRKEISLIKSGKLLGSFRGSEALSLAISDVEGDDLRVIGSGVGDVPVIAQCDDIKTEIIASNAISRFACEDHAIDLDIEVIVNSENLYGDVFTRAAKCAEIVKAGAIGLYIFGGEPTVVLPDNPGEGGRNQGLALAMARALCGEQHYSVLVAGTDGSDGPTGSAGGFITNESWDITPGGEVASDAANSGAWLRQSGGLFVSGPTGTNVMDLMLVLKG